MKYLILLLLLFACSNQEVIDLQAKYNTLEDEKTSLEDQMLKIQSQVDLLEVELSQKDQEIELLNEILIEKDTIIANMQEHEVTISIQQGDEISFIVNNVPYSLNSDDFYPADGWEIYRKVDENWERVVPKTCIQSCDDICTTGEIGCVMGGESPTCELVEGIHVYTWDKKYYKTVEVECDSGTLTCEEIIDAPGGQYKVRFSYLEDCSGDTFPWNDVVYVEEEFAI